MHFPYGSRALFFCATILNPPLPPLNSKVPSGICFTVTGDLDSVVFSESLFLPAVFLFTLVILRLPPFCIVSIVNMLNFYRKKQFLRKNLHVFIREDLKVVITRRYRLVTRASINDIFIYYKAA